MSLGFELAPFISFQALVRVSVQIARPLGPGYWVVLVALLSRHFSYIMALFVVAPWRSENDISRIPILPLGPISYNFTFTQFSYSLHFSYFRNVRHSLCRSPQQLPTTASHNNTFSMCDSIVLSRAHIKSLIYKGQPNVISDKQVLRLDNWIDRHHGGRLPILHMVGKDATDPILV
jgi:hypothetical protein